MVPVIRDAQDKNVWQLRARLAVWPKLPAMQRKSDELSGSTLTVTSLGPLGGIATTRLSTVPKSPLSADKIVERPVFVGDAMKRVS